ncbi:hypothetical protein [Zoogloea sp.]|uniref:hypothetical protein n=1 Tax=Zoogloea sp. TaxID=49181 RepID=UPI0035B1DCB4
MTTLQLARNEARALARGQVHAHPVRFIVGAAVAATGAALFLAQVAQFLAAAI